MTVAVSQLIKTIRQSEKMTQHELGIATKISSTKISNIESGIVKATLEEIAAIAVFFKNVDIVRAYWAESPLLEATIRICDRMGIQVRDGDDVEATAKQFGSDIIDSAQRILQLCSSSPKDVGIRRARIMLVESELIRIGNLATALRLLICDIKG